MFFIAAITGLLILIAIAAFIYGTVQLSRYAFRVSTGRGIATLLFPPYTLYFAFAELDEEEKSLPTASWVFGLFVTALLLAIFWQPITLLATGQTDALAAKTPSGVASQTSGDSEGAQEDEESASTEEAAAESSDDSDESETSGESGESDESSDQKAAEVDASSNETDAGE